MTGYHLEIVPLSRHRWIVRYEGDVTPLSEHPTQADARAEARNWARQFGEPPSSTSTSWTASATPRPSTRSSGPRRRPTSWSGRRAVRVTMSAPATWPRDRPRALAGGHHVCFVGTALGKAEELADELAGEVAVTAAEEAGGDFVLLAVPYTGAPHAVRRHAGELGGASSSTSPTRST